MAYQIPFPPLLPPAFGPFHCSLIFATGARSAALLEGLVKDVMGKVIETAEHKKFSGPLEVEPSRTRDLYLVTNDNAIHLQRGGPLLFAFYSASVFVCLLSQITGIQQNMQPVNE